MMNELEALSVLCSIPHLGSIKVRLLLDRFGSALTALDATAEDIHGLPGFGPKILTGWDAWKKSSAWQHNWGLAERMGVRIISHNDKEYPKRLKKLPDYPLLLYIKGRLLPEDDHGIAVVGTRQASVYGLSMAERLSRELAGHGRTVISGLARGIDTAAHHGALSGGRTIAVIGSGLADIYPKENRALAEKICENGAVLSEFPMQTPPDKSNFPQRNRIVSGMSEATLLIEAPLDSGAMITVEMAIAQGKKIFVLPGRADNENFCGNHSLLKKQQAYLIENVYDIIKEIGDFFNITEKITAFPRNLPILDQDEKKVLALFPGEEISFDELATRVECPVGKLNAVLMGLLLKKAIKEYPGKRYKKLS